MLTKSSLALLWAAIVAAHGDHDQKTMAGPHQSLWYTTLPGDGGTQVRNHPRQAVYSGCC